MSNSFVERLLRALGSKGYDNSCRRSVQTAVLYEAHRCIADKISAMRPFQRKIAFFDQARALLEATGLTPQQQTEVMWRTGTSKETLNPETAWKRLKLVEKELEKISEKVRPLCKDGKSHDDVVNEYICLQFEAVTGQKDKKVPEHWEHTHNNVILTYRMFYNGAEPDTKLPDPVPFKEIVVPVAKPQEEESAYLLKLQGSNSEQGSALASSAAQNMESADDRLGILKEVRAHMDLLNDFVGIIPQEQILKRKRELFLAMPSPPPSTTERLKRLRQTLQGLEGLSEM